MSLKFGDLTLQTVALRTAKISRIKDYDSVDTSKNIEALELLFPKKADDLKRSFSRIFRA